MARGGLTPEWPVSTEHTLGSSKPPHEHGKISYFVKSEEDNAMTNQIQSLMVMGFFFFVIVPIFKSLWAFITKDRTPPVIPEIPDFSRQLSLSDWHIPETAALKWLQENCTTFLSITTTDNHIINYRPDELDTRFRDALIAGRHSLDSSVELHVKGPDGNWTTSSPPISGLIKGRPKLNALYNPIWTYAMTGLKWGAILGAAGKLLDTAIALLAIEPGAALGFAVAIVAVFIPRVGILGVLVVSIVLSQFYRANFFLIGMSSALTGVVLAILPGMALGGLIGLARRGRIRRAADAIDEDRILVLKAVVLPFIAGIAIIAFYWYVAQPWMLSIMQ
jgi:hypothetical protein